MKLKFRSGRELGIQRLMSINLLKRMESSVHSFLLTVKRIYDYLYDTSHAIDDFIATGANSLNEMPDLSGEADEFDYDDQNTDFFNVGKKSRLTCVIWTIFRGNAKWMRISITCSY